MLCMAGRTDGNDHRHQRPAAPVRQLDPYTYYALPHYAKILDLFKVDWTERLTPVLYGKMSNVFGGMF